MYMNLKPNKHKIISFNTTTMISLWFIIVGTPPPPPPPLIKEGDRSLESIEKIKSLGGVRNVLLERRDKSVKGGD